MKQNRIRYVAWILLVVLIMQAAPFGVHAIEADKMAYTSDELTPEYLIGTWEGTYTGSGGSGA